jgi:regulator of protease activity HflC (stomatin/prohibitin superfamily)
MNRENVRSAVSGYVMFIVSFVLAAGAIWSFSRSASTASASFAYLGAALTLVELFVVPGFFIVNPNDARVLVLFGTYKGTIKGNGFFWANPFLLKKRITLRARNLNGEKLKVNDKGGNPIQIAAVVVWRWRGHPGQLRRRQLRALRQPSRARRRHATSRDATVRHLRGQRGRDDALRGGTDHGTGAREGAPSARAPASA